MPPKPGQKRTAIVSRTDAVQPRDTRIQASGIFKFPLELFLEVFSYLADHRRFIRENYYGRELYASMEKKHAERLIAIRTLTMTCWPLRNLLLPLLWTNPEGCISYTRYDHETRTGGSGSNLYAQCVYLGLNQTIAAYVRTFSVHLYFQRAPEGLMETFVNCLLRLPNLRTLEILGAGPRGPISNALKRKHVTFPSIRELRITSAAHHFIRNCPNLEDLTFTSGLDTHAHTTVLLHGKGLRRIAGVDVYSWHGAHGELLNDPFSLLYAVIQRGAIAVGWGCPNLREIGIFSTTMSKGELVSDLQRLKHLTVVEVGLKEEVRYGYPEADLKEARESWKKVLIRILKDSSSTDRKVLRWKIDRSYRCVYHAGLAYDLVESGELVFPGIAL